MGFKDLVGTLLIVDAQIDIRLGLEEILEFSEFWENSQNSCKNKMVGGSHWGKKLIN